jgi:putative transposase
LYHVTSRGNGCARIFFADEDQNRFLGQLSRCLEQYDVVLYAYVLMPNHYHLLVRTRHANLGRFMQRLNTSYALYSRYKHKKPGHRLQGRYKAKLVQGDDYILALTRYIHLNPVKVKSMAGSDAVERQRYLEQYTWSSCHGYLDARRQERLVCYDILKGLGDALDSRRAYRKYLYGFLVTDDADLGAALERSSYGIGDDAYVEELEQELMHRKVGSELDRDVDYPVERICVACVDAVVAEAFGTVVEVLRGNGHAAGAGLAKAVAMELACRLTGLSQRAVGALHGGISSQAVSLARRKARTEVSVEELARLTSVIRSSA